MVIHTRNPHLLERFDMKVDDKLSAMIPDGSLFHQVYERSFFNATHLVYRVKPLSRKRPFSTMDFKTYIPQSTGKKVITHSQMAMMISELCQKAESLVSSDSEAEIIFHNGDEVLLRKKHGIEPFQESFNLQAKSVTQSDSMTKHELTDKCWRFLAPYVSCFTKIEGGGSVYFGVSEDKRSSPMWELTKQNVVNLTESGEESKRKLRKDVTETEVDIHVAKEGKVKEQNSGKFLARPITLPERDREDFRQAILTKVKTDLKWVGAAKPQNPVQVRFHPVTNAPQDQCVIEIKVNYYHGICFYSKTGPESFRCKLQASGTISLPPVEQIGFSDWINSFKQGASGILTGW